MKPEIFRKIIKWIVILIIGHLVGMIIFGIVASSTVTQLAINGSRKAYTVSFWFSLVLQIVFCFIYAKFIMPFNDNDYRREIRDWLKEGNTSAIAYYKERELKEALIKIAAYVVFQLPLAFCSIFFGLSLLRPWSLTQFYIMSAGPYFLLGNAIISLICNTVLFSLVFLYIQILMLAIEFKSVREDLL